MKRLQWMIFCMILLSFTGCKKNDVEDKADGAVVTQEPTGESDQEESVKSTQPEERQEDSLKQIEDQTFEVTLDTWGDVTFASYAPAKEDGDVSFQLLNNKQECIYIFSEEDKDKKLSNEKFDQIKAVAFRDYNNDGKKDILIISQYIQLDTSKAYRQVRLYTQLNGAKEFSRDNQIEEYLMKNYDNETIDSVLEGIKAYREYEKVMGGSNNIETQFQIINDHKEQWISTMDYANDAYHYAVTDLDQNGRLEIITSNTGGTGYYTYSQYYEINETLDGLTKCEQNLVEGDSEADIAMEDTVAFYDELTGNTYYIFYDCIRAVDEYYETMRSISLQNGKIVDTSLASSMTEYKTGGENNTYQNMDGQEIDEDTYSKIADQVYSNLQKQKVTFGWKEFTGNQKIEDLTSDELMRMLRESYDKFTVVNE